MDDDKLAAAARRDLGLAGLAFANLRERYIEEALNAANKGDAWNAILAVRALDSVVWSLETDAETEDIGKTLKENMNG